MFSEHNEQATLMQWAALHERTYPELRMLYAVPNGGHRTARTAALLKAEGVKAGVHDLFLAVPSHGYHGLSIEMKRHGGKPTPQQITWANLLASYGYAVALCVGWEHAKDTIIHYLKGKQITWHHTTKSIS